MAAVAVAELTPPACGLCRAWQPPEDNGKGQCRRRSPFAVQDARTGAWRSMWPPTWMSEWCLVFVPKDEAEPYLVEETTDERT